MTGIFVQEHIHSLHRDELREIADALATRRAEVMEEAVKNIGYNDSRAQRMAGQAELIEDFVREIRVELDRRNAAAQ